MLALFMSYYTVLSILAQVTTKVDGIRGWSYLSTSIEYHNFVFLPMIKSIPIQGHLFRNDLSIQALTVYSQIGIARVVLCSSHGAKCMLPFILATFFLTQGAVVATSLIDL